MFASAEIMIGLSKRTVDDGVRQGSCAAAPSSRLVLLSIIVRILGHIDHGTYSAQLSALFQHRIASCLRESDRGEVA